MLQSPELHQLKIVRSCALLSMAYMPRLELANPMSYPVQNYVVWCLLMVTVLVLHGGPFPSGFFVACQDTNFSFPGFNDAGTNRLIKLGDATAQNSSMYLNNIYYSNISLVNSCGRFLYPDKVRMKSASGQVASFSTSFLFEIILNRAFDSGGRYANSDGLAFLFATDNKSIVKFGDPIGGYYGGEIICVEKAIQASTRLFAVEVDTWLNDEDLDPSDSHIGIDTNTVVHNPIFQNRTYNLCQNHQNTTYCGYFANNAGPFTVWVDYDGPTQMLDVRLSSPGLSTLKPAEAIIHTKVDLSPVLNEFMYVGFSGSFGVWREAHRISSWNFSSNMSSAPSNRRIIAVIVITIVGGVPLSIIICCLILFRGSHRTRIFLAHAGGHDITASNFAEYLYCGLESTWRYKFKLIKVFFDRSLPVGVNFPAEISRELDRTDVGVVIVSAEFFKRKWPMTELLSFVESMRRNPNRVRILPLFYKLSPSDLKMMLVEGYWDAYWRQMSTARHPIDVNMCRDAVQTLCTLRGFQNNFSQSDNFIPAYRRQIVKSIGRMSDKLQIQKMKSFVSDGHGKNEPDVEDFGTWLSKEIKPSSTTKKSSTEYSEEIPTYDDGSSSNIVLDEPNIATIDSNTTYVGDVDQDTSCMEDIDFEEIQSYSNSMQSGGLQWLGVVQNLINMVMTSLNIKKIPSKVKHGSNQMFQCLQENANGIIVGRFDTTLMQIQILFSSLESMVEVTGVGLKLEPNKFVLVTLNGHDSSEVSMTVLEKDDCEKLMGDDFYILHLEGDICKNQTSIDTPGNVSQTSTEFKHDTFPFKDLEEDQNYETSEEDQNYETSDEDQNYETSEEDFSTYTYRVHTIAKLLLLLRCGENGDILFWSKIRDFLLVWNWEDIKMAFVDYEEKWKGIYNWREQFNERGGDGSRSNSKDYNGSNNASSTNNRKDKSKYDSKNHGAFRSGRGVDGGEEGDDEGDDYNHGPRKSLSFINSKEDQNYSITVYPGYGCYQKVHGMDYDGETWTFKNLEVYAVPVITISFQNWSKRYKRQVHVNLKVNFDLANDSGPQASDLEVKRFAWYHDSFEFSIQCIDEGAAELVVGSGSVHDLKVVSSTAAYTTTKNSESYGHTLSTEFKTSSALPVQNSTKFSATKLAPTTSWMVGQTKEGLDTQTVNGFVAREKFDGGPKPRIGCAFKHTKSKDIESCIHEANGKFPDLEMYLFEPICSSQTEVIEGSFRPVKEANRYYQYEFNCQRDIIGFFWKSRRDQASNWTSKLKEKMTCTSDERSIKESKYWKKVTCGQTFCVPLYINHGMSDTSKSHIHKLAMKYQNDIPPITKESRGYRKVLEVHPLEERNSHSIIEI